MDSEYDLIVIGGGAAGLSAAQYGARANLKTLLVEELAAGGQALLIDALENYPGVMGPVSGYDFSEVMRVQAEDFGASFLDGDRERPAQGRGALQARDERREPQRQGRRCSRRAPSTGTSGVPGEEEFAGRGVSYCATCDGPFFKGKRMLVVGGRRRRLRRVGLPRQALGQDRRRPPQGPLQGPSCPRRAHLSNPNIEVRFNTVVKENQGQQEGGVGRPREGRRRRNYEEPSTPSSSSSARSPRRALAAEAEKDEAGYLLTDDRMATSQRGLFAAGDVRACSFRQLVTAASDGAIAAHSASQYIDEMNGEAYATLSPKAAALSGVPLHRS